MRNLRTWLLLFTVLVVGVGFYRGWFVLSSSPVNSENHKVNIHLTVDPEKAKDDAGKVKASVQDKAHDLSNKLAD